MSVLAISEDEFNDLSFTYSVESINSEFQQHEMQTGYNRDGEDEFETRFESWVGGSCTAKSGELTVEFGWVAKGGDETYQAAHDFEITIEGDHCSNREFTLIGFKLVDEDGDELDDWVINELLREKFNGCEWEDLVEAELPKAEITCIDIDEDSDMKTYEIHIDDEPNIRFTGEHIASASSSDNQAMGSSFSGDTGRWTELRLYKTKGGKYICQQIGRTKWLGEHDRFTGKVCETVDEVIKFFGHRWLAKELYKNAGISDAVEVD